MKLPTKLLGALGLALASFGLAGCVETSSSPPPSGPAVDKHAPVARPSEGPGVRPVEVCPAPIENNRGDGCPGCGRG